MEMDKKVIHVINYKKIIFPYQQKQLLNSFVALLHHSVEIFFCLTSSL